MSPHKTNILHFLQNKNNKESSKYSSGMVFCVFFVIFVSFCFSITFSSNVFAGTSTLSVTVANNLSLDIIPTSTNGNFATSSSTDPTITVSTDHYTGYTLGITAKTANSNALINTSDSNKTIPSITSAVSEQTYKSSTNLNNTWGYRPSKYGSQANTNFLPAPTSSTIQTILDQTNSANTTEYNITIGARVDSSTAIGTYENTFVITVTTNPIPYTINYNDPSGQASNMPANQPGSTISDTATITLRSNIPTRTGYTFKGWCTVLVLDDAICTNAEYQPGSNYTVNIDQVNDTNTFMLYARWEKVCGGNKVCYSDNGANSSTKMGDQSIYSSSSTIVLWASNFQRSNYGFAGWNTKADGTGTSYGPNQTITKSGISNFSTDGLKLYAMWVQSTGNIQNWNGCSTLTKADEATNILTQSITALTDTRDNNTYAIARLADGNCWMIENLRLGKSEAMGLSADTTQSAGTLPASTTSWNTSSSPYTVQQINASNTLSPVSNMTTPDANVYSYGNYYSWAAAINSNTSYSSSSSATTSICPKGWVLPIGSSGVSTINKSFSNLDTKLGGTGNTQYTNEASERWRQYPNNYIASGYWRTDYADFRDTYGFYWSRTTGSNSITAFDLQVSSTNTLKPVNYERKYNGESVRCVFDG